MKAQKGYTLVHCTIAPGIEIDHFTLGNREVLLLSFPHLKQEIEEFTKRV